MTDRFQKMKRAWYFVRFCIALRQLPVNDDLDRALCRQAGSFGHRMCGWCKVHDRPKFACLACLDREAWAAAQKEGR